MPNKETPRPIDEIIRLPTLPKLAGRDEALTMLRHAAASGFIQEDDLQLARHDIATSNIARLKIENDRKRGATLSYSQAATILQKAGIDLENHREQAVRSHTRWGLVNWMKKSGLISSVDQYGALFDEATFTEGGLKKVIRAAKDGENWEITFNANKIKFDTLWMLIVGEKSSETVQELVGFDPIRKINPYDVVHYGEGSDWKDIMGAYQYGYENGVPWGQAGKPKIEFSKRRMFKGGEMMHHALMDAVYHGYDLADPGSSLLRLRSRSRF